MTQRSFISHLGKILAFLLCFIFASSWCYAKPLSTLYEVPLACESQQEAERQALFTQGFLQVLGRLSSDPHIGSAANVKAALKHVVDYVEQYTYEKNTLVVRYNEALIKELLGKTGGAVWGSDRPQVVLWLALEQNDERHLVGAETDPDVHATLKKIAQQQGLPLVLPLMDLEDVSLVTVTDVWGQFTDVLTTASQRYHAKILLVGRLKQVEGRWQSDWTLRYADLPTRWQGEGNSLEKVMENALQKTSQYLRQQLAVPTNSHQTAGQPLLIGIQGIRTRGDFKNVSRYLNHLNGIKSVEVQQVIGDTALFEIIPYGSQGKATFAQMLNGEQHLIAAIPRQSLANVDLVYEWEP